MSMTWRAIHGRPYPAVFRWSHECLGAGPAAAAQGALTFETDWPEDEIPPGGSQTVRFMFTPRAACADYSSLVVCDVDGRGLHSSTFQLNLSRFWHKIHPRHPLIPPDTPYTPPRQPLTVPPIPQKALKLSRKVAECKPLVDGMPRPLGFAVAADIRGLNVEYDILKNEKVVAGDLLNASAVIGDAVCVDFGDECEVRRHQTMVGQCRLTLSNRC